ncbi:MAG: hypothetical protein QOF70_7364 [Acetobacteraceae bacterium]|jgi:hypothetical protein|nr:hypothetical protein [Acetobacteraceae bacterium]
MAHYETNRQVIHLSKAKRCLDQADHLSHHGGADQNIRYQQNLAGRRMALLVLGTNQLDILFANVERIRSAIDRTTTGAYLVVEFDRPPLLRRPYPPPSD